MSAIEQNNESVVAASEIDFLISVLDDFSSQIVKQQKSVQETSEKLRTQAIAMAAQNQLITTLRTVLNNRTATLNEQQSQQQ